VKMTIAREILTFGPTIALAVIGVLFIAIGASDRRRAKADIEWVEEMRRKYPFLNTAPESPQQSQPDSGSGYVGNTGDLSLPDRIRVYAMTSGRVQITLSQKNAQLLADDIERGMAARRSAEDATMTEGKAP